ncbi:MAG: ComF family protein [Clostridiales bacterium]
MRNENIMEDLIERITNLIFPPKCIFCQKIINFDTKLFSCQECYKNLSFKYKKQPLIKSIDNFYFDQVICIFEYADDVKEAIKNFKFNGRSDFGKKFADIIQFSTKNMTKYEKFDIIISVPLHNEKLKSRGYNQSFLISKNLSKKLKIKEGSMYLKKVKKTKNQNDLSKFDRMSNLKGAFEVLDSENFLIGKKVILIDDVFTTGSTLNECSRVLKLNGVIEITILVLASGSNFNF